MCMYVFKDQSIHLFLSYLHFRRRLKVYWNAISQSAKLNGGGGCKIACLIQCAHSPRARTECALVILDLVLWIDLHEMIILYNSNIYHRFIDIDRID